MSIPSLLVWKSQIFIKNKWNPEYQKIAHACLIIFVPQILAYDLCIPTHTIYIVLYAAWKLFSYAE